jgi:hypothetical protein
MEIFCTDISEASHVPRPQRGLAGARGAIKFQKIGFLQSRNFHSGNSQLRKSLLLLLVAFVEESPILIQRTITISALGFSGFLLFGR